MNFKLKGKILGGVVLDINQKGEIIIYQTEKGETKIDVYM